MCIRDRQSAFLCHTTHYSPGYHYSEYTHEDASYSLNTEYLPIDKIYGIQDGIEELKTLIIFESRDKANEYINDYYGETRINYEVLSFAEVDAIVEQLLLGNTSENNSI